MLDYSNLTFSCIILGLLWSMALTKLLLNQMLRHKWIYLILLTACLALFLSLHFPYVECVTSSYLYLPQILCLFSFTVFVFVISLYMLQTWHISFFGLWNDKLYSVQNTFLYTISEAGVICSSWHFILYKSCIFRMDRSWDRLFLFVDFRV